MGDHSLRDDTPAAPPDIVEAKVAAAALLTMLASVAAAILNAVQDNPALLGALPPWLQFVLIAAIPPVLTFLAGYTKTSNRV
ncbi:MAG: hypothetical protein L0H84_10075 [Pseudonocardia sp.]|nr:hypothetical protein [Pseudonocardia sp.]